MMKITPTAQGFSRAKAYTKYDRLVITSKQIRFYDGTINVANLDLTYPIRYDNGDTLTIEGISGKFKLEAT